MTKMHHLSVVFEVKVTTKTQRNQPEGFRKVARVRLTNGHGGLGHRRRGYNLQSTLSLCSRWSRARLAWCVRYHIVRGARPTGCGYAGKQGRSANGAKKEEK